MSEAASTHEEIYRRFDGELSPHPLRFWPLFRSQVRVHYKKKLPLLLFFAGPAITTIIVCFAVYGRFTLQERMETRGLATGQDLATTLVVTAATQAVETMLTVRVLIALGNAWTLLFAMLAMAWYGAGSIAEDNKLGAQLLYFSRPLTRLDYFLGHFMTVAWFGLLAVMAPGIVICIVATFTSPEYSFLLEEWDVPLAAAAYGAITVTLLSSLILGASSLVQRKSFALVAIVAFIAASEPLSAILSELLEEPDLMMVGIPNNVIRIGDWLFSLDSDSRIGNFGWDPWYSMAIVGGLIVASLTVCWLRLRRMEGVG